VVLANNNLVKKTDAEKPVRKDAGRQKVLKFFLYHKRKTFSVEQATQSSVWK